MQLVLNGAELAPAAVITVPSVYQQLLRVIEARLPDRGVRGSLIRVLRGLPAGRMTRRLAHWLRPWLMPEVDATVGTRVKVMIIGAAPSSEELKKALIALGLPIYEGYGLSETNMIACNVPHSERFGTVGPVWPGVSVRVTDTGRVQARLQEPRTTSYLNVDDAENTATFLEDGWVDSGDLGRMDRGYLTITGRAKDIIVTDRGKNVNPAPIEQRLQAITGVEHALVFGDNRPFLVALVNCSTEAKLDSARMRDHLEAINEQLPAHERIRDFVLLEDAFNESNGLITRTGKPRRQVIERHYSQTLEALYG